MENVGLDDGGKPDNRDGAERDSGSEHSGKPTGQNTTTGQIVAVDQSAAE
jgi:hypothetical protein